MTDQSVSLQLVVTKANPKRASRATRRSRGRKNQARRARRKRNEGRTAARREAILTAALAEFSARGFAAARLDDVARRAGVAKGTIYLYFRDKEALFQELVRSAMSPVVERLERASHAEASLRAVAAELIELFVREICDTPRQHVIRLIISEGPRFPKLARFYYREVVARALDAVRALLRRGRARGETMDAALLRFPQLLAAPGIVAILWNGLFGQFAPLDARKLLRAHFALLFGDGR